VTLDVMINHMSTNHDLKPCHAWADRAGLVQDAPPLGDELAQDPALAALKLVAWAADDTLLPRAGERGFPHWGRWAERNKRFTRDIVQWFAQGAQQQRVPSTPKNNAKTANVGMTSSRAQHDNTVSPAALLRKRHLCVPAHPLLCTATIFADLCASNPASMCSLQDGWLLPAGVGGPNAVAAAARLQGSADLLDKAWESELPGNLACGRRPAFGLNAVSSPGGVPTSKIVDDSLWHHPPFQDSACAPCSCVTLALLCQCRSYDAGHSASGM